MLRLPPVAQCLCLRDEIGKGKRGRVEREIEGRRSREDVKTLVIIAQL